MPFSAPIPDDANEALAELNARNRWASVSNSLRSRFRHKSTDSSLDGLEYLPPAIPDDEDLERDLPGFLR